MERGYARGWLAAALGVSFALVVGSPFVGPLSGWLRDVARGQYQTLLAGVLFATAAAGLLIAALRIRDRRGSRYASLLGALGVAAAYAYVTRSGVPDVDAAERLHLVEYGLVAVLFYLAVRPVGDGSAFVLPVLAGIIVGTLEEGLQWFVPGRVGEARDVMLNLVAVGCGVLFGVGLDPPARFSVELEPSSRRPVAVAAAAALLVFAAFFHAVHLGYDIVDREAGVFQSRYSSEQLAAVAHDRTRRWQHEPPLTRAPLSREDQYLSEGIAHVRRRNERWTEGNLLAAGHENLILEKYYAPVLDTPSYVSETSHRWSAEQREQATARRSGAPGFMIYASDALPYPVFTWPRGVYWTAVALLTAGVLRAIIGGHKV